VIHGSQAHLLTNVFAESNESDANNSGHLMNRLFVIIFVFSAQVQHLLNFEHVAGACIGTSFDHELAKGSRGHIRNELANFHGRLGSTLLTQEKKTKSESKKSHK